MVINKLIVTSILVRDQEEALDYYTKVLGFVKRNDFAIPGKKGERWLTVAPKNQKEIEILLRKPRAGENELVIKEIEQKIGKGSVSTFSTDDCQHAYQVLSKKGVSFISPPAKSINGVQAVFEDLYGNRFTLLEIPK